MGATLSFLPITLLSAGERQRKFSEEALLDTGATVSCISNGLTQNLQLDVETGNEETLWSATSDQQIFSVGTVKVKFRWPSQTRSNREAKVKMYVIPGLSSAVVLSNRFINKHPDVRNAAKTKRVFSESIAWVGFRKLEGKRLEDETMYQQQQSQQNQALDDEMVDNEEAELDRCLGVSGRLSTSTTNTTDPTTTHESGAAVHSQPGSSGGAER